MRILIAEDDPVSRRVLQAVLSRLGHPCEIAEDGAQAWDLFIRLRPDVLITDWMMPGLDGADLCRRIRAHSGPYCYVILLTALGDHDHVLEGMRAGADDYMTKPVDRNLLETRLVAAARVRGLHARLAEREADLRELNAMLRAQTRRDELTGLGNRFALRHDLAALDARSRRYGQTYCIALCDVDRFKVYNDTHGHQAGDEVLRRVAGAIEGELRSGDSAYRYGGEEIALVFAEQGEQGAATALERMRRSVAALAIPHPGNPPAGVVTISAGAALDGGADSEDVLRRADAALYRAKGAGRDRVVIDEPPRPP